METIVLKNRIRDFVERADERVLNIVNSVFENYYDEETVAYFPDGAPMSRKEYKERLDMGLKQMEKGDYVSAEELKQISISSTKHLEEEFKNYKQHYPKE